MMKKLLTLILLGGSLLFLAGCSDKPFDLEARKTVIAELDQVLEHIDQTNYDFETYPLDEGSEGAQLLVYKNPQGEIVKLRVEVYANMGNFITDFYLQKEKLIAAVTKNTFFAWDEEENIHALDTENTELVSYFFDAKEKLIATEGNTEAELISEEELLKQKEKYLKLPQQWQQQSSRSFMGHGNEPFWNL